MSELNRLTGGAGNDVFVLGDKNGSFYDAKEYQDFATITDFTLGEDTIVLAGASTEYSFTSHSNDLAGIFKNGDLVAALDGTAGQDLTGSLVFLQGDSPTTEPPTTEPPTTEPPTTEPPASDGENLIEGSSDNDVLIGTSGNDRLIGYVGIDRLTGGAGNDVFVLGDENGSFYDAKEYQDFATITDFTLGEDTIVLAGASTEYSFTSHSNDLAGIFKMEIS